MPFLSAPTPAFLPSPWGCVSCLPLILLHKYTLKVTVSPPSPYTPAKNTHSPLIKQVCSVLFGFHFNSALFSLNINRRTFADCTVSLTPHVSQDATISELVKSLAPPDTCTFFHSVKFGCGKKTAQGC